MLNLTLTFSLDRDRLPARYQNLLVSEFTTLLNGGDLAIPLIDTFILRSTEQQIISLIETKDQS